MTRMLCVLNRCACAYVVNIYHNKRTFTNTHAQSMGVNLKFIYYGIGMIFKFCRIEFIAPFSFNLIYDIHFVFNITVLWNRLYFVTKRIIFEAYSSISSYDY